jgi:hypothetical protein
MSAFQTTLFPLTAPAEIKRLNCIPKETLISSGLNATTEIERALATITPVGHWGRLDVHYVGDLLDLMMNLRGWNEDVATLEGQKAWGRRHCSYFVYDPISKMFAPSKFCAYIPVLSGTGNVEGPSANWSRMTTALYSELNDGTHMMDGQKAWHHLTAQLGMRATTILAASAIAAHFAHWQEMNRTIVAVRGGEPTVLIPPGWYTTRLS